MLTDSMDLGGHRRGDLLMTFLVGALTLPAGASPTLTTRSRRRTEGRHHTLGTRSPPNLVNRLSTPRYEGTIEVTSATDASERDAAREIKGGDTATVETGGPAQARTTRVMEVEYTPEAVTLGIEQDGSPTLLLALAPCAPTRAKRGRRP